MKAKTLSTSTSVSRGWQLTPNIYVGGESAMRRGQAMQRDDRMTRRCPFELCNFKLWPKPVFGGICRPDQVGSIQNFSRNQGSTGDWTESLSLGSVHVLLCLTVQVSVFPLTVS